MAPQNPQVPPRDHPSAHRRARLVIRGSAASDAGSWNLGSRASSARTIWRGSWGCRHRRCPVAQNAGWWQAPFRRPHEPRREHGPSRRRVRPTWSHHRTDRDQHRRPNPWSGLDRWLHGATVRQYQPTIGRRTYRANRRPGGAALATSTGREPRGPAGMPSCSGRRRVARRWASSGTRGPALRPIRLVAPGGPLRRAD